MFPDRSYLLPSRQPLSSSEEVCLAEEWVHRTEIVRDIKSHYSFIHFLPILHLPPPPLETVLTGSVLVVQAPCVSSLETKRKLFSRALCLSSSPWLLGFLLSLRNGPRAGGQFSQNLAPAMAQEGLGEILYQEQWSPPHTSHLSILP